MWSPLGARLHLTVLVGLDPEMDNKASKLGGCPSIRREEITCVRRDGGLKLV